MAYVTGLLALCLGLAAVLVDLGPVHNEDPLGLVVLSILAFVSVKTRDVSSDGASSSFTTVILLSAVPLVGPLPAGIMGLLLAFADRRYAFTVVGTFNGAMIGAMTFAGGVTYTLLRGVYPVPTTLLPVELLQQVGGPLFAADLVMCLVNVLALVGMVGISGGEPRAVLLGAVRQLVPLHLVYGIIAFVFVLLWRPAGVGPLSALLIAAPLAIARFVYVQYGDEVRARARILAMFTAAADTADGRLATHARRVDELCRLMTAHLGLTEADRRDLGYAAALHDIAMKRVTRATDHPPGTGSYTDVRSLVPHPRLASEMLEEVQFLAGAAIVIRSHHERMDGRGYPDGLRASQIPLTARILAVADAFDALTTTRGERVALDRDAGLAELRLSAGEHLDPALVDVLARVLKDRSWEPHTEHLTEGSWLWDHHTLPAMSDIIADELATKGPGPDPEPAPRSNAGLGAVEGTAKDDSAPTTTAQPGDSSATAAESLPCSPAEATNPEQQRALRSGSSRSTEGTSP